MKKVVTYYEEYIHDKSGKIIGHGKTRSGYYVSETKNYCFVKRFDKKKPIQIFKEQVIKIK